MTRQDVCRQRGLFPSGNSPKETLLCKSFESIAHVAGFVLLLEDCAPPNLPKDFFDSLNKYPPAKPGVFHRRVKPWNTSARVTSRWYGLPVAKDCYLPPVNGLFRYFPSSTVLQLCLLPAGAVCILLFSLHFCPLCQRSTLCTRTPGCGIYTSIPGTIRISSGCSSLSGIP